MAKLLSSDPCSSVAKSQLLVFFGTSEKKDLRNFHKILQVILFFISILYYTSLIITTTFTSLIAELKVSRLVKISLLVPAPLLELEIGRWGQIYIENPVCSV